MTLLALSYDGGFIFNAHVVGRKARTGTRKALAHLQTLVELQYVIPEAGGRAGSGRRYHMVSP